MGHIGDLLRLYRMKLGLSQAKLAVEVPTSAQSISNYELEERLPDIYTFIRLKEVLGFEWWEIEQRKICEFEEVEEEPYLWNDICKPRLTNYQEFLDRCRSEERILFDWDSFLFIEAINLSYKPCKSFFVVDVTTEDSEFIENKEDRKYYEVDSRTMLEMYVDYQEGNDIFETVQALGLYDFPDVNLAYKSEYPLQHPEWLNLFSFVYDISEEIGKNKKEIYRSNSVILNDKCYFIEKANIHGNWAVQLAQQLHEQVNYIVGENTSNVTFQSLVDTTKPIDKQIIEWAVKMIEQEKVCEICENEKTIIELQEWQYENFPEYRGRNICKDCYSEAQQLKSRLQFEEGRELREFLNQNNIQSVLQYSEFSKTKKFQEFIKEMDRKSPIHNKMGRIP
jgi:transcriptional regulator with XRE-family HTH domain